MFLHRLRGLIPRLVALGLTVVGGCIRGKPDEPRLVILYATCSLNREYLAPYNDSVAFTPNLRRFGKESLVFDKHVTEAGQSGIAFASLFSSVHAHTHGAYRHPARLPESLYQISEAYRDAGYDTYFWSGHRMGSWEFGYGQGVTTEHAFLTRAQNMPAYTATDVKFKALLDKLRDEPDYKAFVQINFTLSHSPYNAHATDDVLRRFLELYPEHAPDGVSNSDIARLVALYNAWRLPLQWNFEETVERLRLGEEDLAKLIAILEMLYKACIWQLDNYFGQFIQSIDDAGLHDQSLIVFTADHGEILYRENAPFKWAHGLDLAPEVLDVPLMIRAPFVGVEPGRYDHVTRSIDVYPTMTGLCGIGPPAQTALEGVDLSAVLLGEASAPNLLAYSQMATVGGKLLEEFKDWTTVISLYPRDDAALTWVRVREGDVVYKWRNLGNEVWGFEVFDLAADRTETTNLYDPDNVKHREMTARLEAHKARLVEGFAKTVRARAENGPSPQDAEASLRALGYIGDVPDSDEH